VKFGFTLGFGGPFFFEPDQQIWRGFLMQIKAAICRSEENGPRKIALMRERIVRG
jgi:hypothetical protein